MGNRVYDIYTKEIEKIISYENTESVFLVGSSKSIDIENSSMIINDFDIFVIVSKGNTQTRIIKTIDNLEFDINIFSKEGIYKLIDSREYFFLKEMSNPKILYDLNDEAKDLISICKKKLSEGPKKLSQSEKEFLKSQTKGNLDRINNNSKIDFFEFEFLTNLYLKDIIVGYFTINNKWVPKDKKLLSTLKKEDINLYNLVEQTLKTKKYEDLLNVHNYAFNNIKVSKNIKITY